MVKLVIVDQHCSDQHPVPPSLSRSVQATDLKGRKGQVWAGGTQIMSDLRKTVTAAFSLPVTTPRWVVRANTSQAVGCSAKHSEQDELIDNQQADCSLWPAFQRDLSPKHYFIFLSARKADSVLPHVELSSQSQLDVLSTHLRWLRDKSCCNVSPWRRLVGCTYPAGQQVKLPACFCISRWCLQATLILGQNLPHGQWDSWAMPIFKTLSVLVGLTSPYTSL